MVAGRQPQCFPLPTIVVPSCHTPPPLSAFTYRVPPRFRLPEPTLRRVQRHKPLARALSVALGGLSDASAGQPPRHR